MSIDALAEWRDQAEALLPPHLHPAVQAATAALSAVDRPSRRWPCGREYLFEVELLSRVSWMGPDSADEDRVLSGVGRLIRLGWLKWRDMGNEKALVIDIPSDFTYPQRREPRPERSRSHISRRRRLEVYLRDGWECWLCGLQVEPPIGDTMPSRWEASVDHAIPHCDGGSDKVDNLRTAHRWCNSTRGARETPDKRVMRARVICLQANEFAVVATAS